jgi:MSHA biogenesis protein MshI
MPSFATADEYILYSFLLAGYFVMILYLHLTRDCELVFKKKNSSQTNWCAVGLNGQGLSVASVKVNNKQSPKLSALQFYQDIFDIPQLIEPLSDWVREQQLESAICEWVLDPDHYELISLDRPNVPDNELALAARWQIKDLIDFPLEQAAIEVFSIPPHGPGNLRKKIYAVVTKITYLQQGVNALQKAGLSVKYINIQELALRNLTALYPEDSKGIAVLSLSPHGNYVTMTQNKCVYFSRKIDLNYQELLPFLKPADKNYPFDLRAVDALLLELTRSFDYYTTQLSQNAPVKLLVPPLVDPQSALAIKIKEMLGTELIIFDLPIELAAKGSWDAQTQARCFGILGSVAGCQERINATAN